MCPIHAPTAFNPATVFAFFLQRKEAEDKNVIVDVVPNGGNLVLYALRDDPDV